MSGDDLVELGVISRPWGVHGEVKVRPTSDIPDRFTDLSGVWLYDGIEMVRYHAVRKVKQLNDAVVLTLDGIGTREAAEAVRNWTVAVPEGERAPLGDGEYYIDDLIGLEVEDRAGKPVGRLVKVYQGAAQDVFEIETPGGPVLVPAVSAFIIAVDPSYGRMVVELPVIEAERPAGGG